MARGSRPPVISVAPDKTGCKVAIVTPVFTARHRIAGIKLHDSLNHVLCHPEFLTPKMHTWPPRWPPQTAAARSAPALETEIPSQDPTPVVAFGASIRHSTLPPPTHTHNF